MPQRDGVGRVFRGFQGSSLMQKDRVHSIRMRVAVRKTIYITAPPVAFITAPDIRPRGAPGNLPIASHRARFPRSR